MNWHLVSYADENFVEEQKFLHQTHKEGFVNNPYIAPNIHEPIKIEIITRVIVRVEAPASLGP